LSYAEPWLEPECEPEPLPEPSFELSPDMDPHRLVAQGGMAAAATTAGTVPKGYHWYDAIEDGASFLFDWLVQENTAYAPKTEEEASDPNKRSISDEEHAAMSGMFWLAGRAGGAVADRLGPFARRLLPKGWVQALPLEPIIAGGTTGTTGAVGDQVVQDASRGELSGWQTYADRALGGLKGGVAVGGALGLLGRARRFLPEQTREAAGGPVEAPPNPNRGMTKAEWKAAQSSRRRLARENQRIGVAPEKPIDITVGPQPTAPRTGARATTQERYASAESADRARRRAESYDQPDPKTQHGYGDHGAHVAESQHRERMATGRTPGGHLRRPPTRSSNFESSAAHTEAVERARRQLQRRSPPTMRRHPRTGQLEPNIVTELVAPRRAHSYGSGLEESPGGGPPQASGPLHRARVTFRYNPQTGEWDVLTSFPER